MAIKQNSFSYVKPKWKKKNVLNPCSEIPD